MSSTSSSSPEPGVIPIKTKDKPKEKTKKKIKRARVFSAAAADAGHGKNEGANDSDPRWKYEPPPGAVLLDHDVDTGCFDWDAVNDDEDVELWLIRIPEAVKPKYLEHIKIEPPSSSKSERLGVMERKYATYDIWSVARHPEKEDKPIGGEEITGLSCLLSRKRKNGKLYQASKPIARHIVVSAQAVTPTSNLATHMSSSATLSYQSTPREVYPKERLKHRFLPFGASISDDDLKEVGVMSVGNLADQLPPLEKSVDHPELGKTKRKRKGEGDSQAKTKKPRKAR